MKDTERKQLALSLIETASAAYLTTVDNEGYPQTRAMFNLRNKQQFPGLVDFFSKHPDDFIIYFSTNTSSMKLVQLQANPKASVYYCQPENFHGLQLSGDLEIVTDPAIREALWQPGWELYYPGKAHDPDHTILALRPTLLKHYYQLSSARLELSGGSNQPISN